MKYIYGNKRTALLAALFVVLPIWSIGLDAHGVSGKDAVFLQGLDGRAIGALMYLGASTWSPGTTTCCSSSA